MPCQSPGKPVEFVKTNRVPFTRMNRLLTHSCRVRATPKVYPCISKDIQSQYPPPKITHEHTTMHHLHIRTTKLQYLLCTVIFGWSWIFWDNVGRCLYAFLDAFGSLSYTYMFLSNQHRGRRLWVVRYPNAVGSLWHRKWHKDPDRTRPAGPKLLLRVKKPWSFPTWKSGGGNMRMNLCSKKWEIC